MSKKLLSILLASASILAGCSTVEKSYLFSNPDNNSNPSYFSQERINKYELKCDIYQKRKDSEYLEYIFPVSRDKIKEIPIKNPDGSLSYSYSFPRTELNSRTNTNIATYAHWKLQKDVPELANHLYKMFNALFFNVTGKEPFPEDIVSKTLAFEEIK